MSYEQRKLEYEGKVQLAEDAAHLLKKAKDDIKESAIKQHEKDKEQFARIKAETRARHEEAVARGKFYRERTKAQTSKKQGKHEEN